MSSIGFSEWVRRLDRRCEARLDLSLSDLEDLPFRDWYDEGLTVEEAWERVVEFCGLPTGNEVPSLTWREARIRVFRAIVDALEAHTIDDVLATAWEDLPEADRKRCQAEVGRLALGMRQYADELEDVLNDVSH